MPTRTGSPANDGTAARWNRTATQVPAAVASVGPTSMTALAAWPSGLKVTTT